MRVEMERADLVNNVNVAVNIEINKVIDNKILTIILLDNSYSMEGSKYTSALEGVYKLVNDIKENETIKVIQFADNINASLSFRPDNKPTYQELVKLLDKRMGSTALYDTIYSTFNDYAKNRLKEDNFYILYNVFTDGGDNISKKNNSDVNEIIKLLQDNKHTFTFIGTTQDEKLIKRTFNVDSSNLLTYTNNSKGVTTAFNKTLSARGNYMKSVSRGEDVSLGFYSKVLKED